MKVITSVTLVDMFQGKEPELPLLGVKRSKSTGNIQIFNMGVDYDKYGNDYWKKLERENEELLNVIPFSSDRSKINKYWSSVGANCITGIYEPFGYTMCETLDRRVPAIGHKILMDQVKLLGGWKIMCLYTM